MCHGFCFGRITMFFEPLRRQMQTAPVDVEIPTRRAQVRVPNHVTVRREHGARVTYDPRRLQGVTLYREADRAFAIGDRVQLTAPDHEHHLANQELGTVEELQPKDHLRLHLDSGRTVDLNLRAHPHVDYGYAVTSHSAQGQTADRVPSGSGLRYSRLSSRLESPRCHGSGP
jgi:ATP-dependent exoDNAse (exonuclease V) alpha subunit